MSACIIEGRPFDSSTLVLPADASFWLKQAKATIESNLMARKEIKGKAKNVIIFMGDGMSIPTLAAARVYMGGENQKLSFEKFPAVGLSKVPLHHSDSTMHPWN